jgi:CRISPR-associated endonuclease/helicase Cas3
LNRADSTCASFFQYWGKASRSDPAAYHLLPYHCLDVAAVAETILLEYDGLRRTLAGALAMAEPDMVRLAVWLVALHDIGKFSDAFQAKRHDIAAQLGRSTGRVRGDIRHDAMGLCAWAESVFPVVSSSGLTLEGEGADDYAWCDALQPLVEAAMGHHGKPAESLDKAGIRLRVRAVFTADNQEALVDFVNGVSFLLPEPPRAVLTWRDDMPDRCRQASWIMAGLFVLADWLGSNEKFFRPQRTCMPLQNYWARHAAPTAREACAQCGILPAAPSGRNDWPRLFGDIEHPSPLQEWAETVGLATGPQLFVIEDLTGSGKTEAALLLAQRLMNHGAADGLYFALPTMATANAMFQRVHAMYRRLFSDEAQPSLVLAHGQRELSPLFQSVAYGDTGYSPGGEEREGAHAARLWVADNRKKALLASVGVGTIDQALLAVLPARHQSLRLLGLSRRLLIVDEVHACDAYMHKLLCSLLEFQAGLGGSAILLSATLPLTMRRELATAFRRGLGEKTTRLSAEAYPLVTHVHADGEWEAAVAARREIARRVEISFLHDTGGVVELLKSAAAGGRCACWIRNTVSDAREGRALLQQSGVTHVELFHAKFTMGDRLATEKRVLELCGPQSTAATRAGRLVVATQVAEQSLDLDFDLLITDLAPVDRIIQRAGRLCRHHRTALGDRISGRDQRGEPRLWILAPASIDEPDEDWFKEFLPGAAAVYPHHGRLWLTQKLLLSGHGLSMPDDARRLIEGVYGADSSEALPSRLRPIEDRCTGDRMAQSSVAAQNALKLADGYRKTWRNWVDDRVTPTRLGEESLTLRLARWEQGRLVPWYASPQNAWALSDVSVQSIHVSHCCLTAEEQQAVEEAMSGMPDGGEWCLIVPLREGADGLWRAKTVNARDETATLLYDTDNGLRIERDGA